MSNEVLSLFKIFTSSLRAILCFSASCFFSFSPLPSYCRPSSSSSSALGAAAEERETWDGDTKGKRGGLFEKWGTEHDFFKRVRACGWGENGGEKREKGLLASSCMLAPAGGKRAKTEILLNGKTFFRAGSETRPLVSRGKRRRKSI